MAPRDEQQLIVSIVASYQNGEGGSSLVSIDARGSARDLATSLRDEGLLPAPSGDEATFADYSVDPPISGTTALPAALLPQLASIRPAAFLLSLAPAAADPSGFEWSAVSRWSPQRSQQLGGDAPLAPVAALQRLHSRRSLQPLRCAARPAGPPSAAAAAAPPSGTITFLAARRGAEPGAAPLRLALQRSATLWDLKAAIQARTGCQAGTLSVYLGSQALCGDFQLLHALAPAPAAAGGAAAAAPAPDEAAAAPAGAPAAPAAELPAARAGGGGGEAAAMEQQEAGGVPAPLHISFACRWAAVLPERRLAAGPDAQQLPSPGAAAAALHPVRPRAATPPHPECRPLAPAPARQVLQRPGLRPARHLPRPSLRQDAQRGGSGAAGLPQHRHGLRPQAAAGAAGHVFGSGGPAAHLCGCVGAALGGG
jgi:hypothetical protein